MNQPATTARYVLVDWGTSSFRLWGVTTNGDILFESKTPFGMSKLQPIDFEDYFEAALDKLEVPDDVPALICGMAGAAQGWQDAGYIDAPMGLSDIASTAIRIGTKSGRDVRILPGVAQRNVEHPNVMRGEETLLLGAVNLELQFSVYCLPGTHSKWAFMDGNKLNSFFTMMTGEIFELLSDHSTLSPYLKGQGQNDIDLNAFEIALKQTLSDPNKIFQTLFNLRAGPLIGDPTNVNERRAKLSGILIGAELATIREKANGMVGLIASGLHAQLYSHAFVIAGIDFESIDSNALALAGLLYAANSIWSQNEN